MTRTSVRAQQYANSHAYESVPLVGRRRLVLTDANPFELLKGRVAGRLRADNRNLKTGVSKRTGLEPDAPVERDRQVLHDDEDSSSRLSASPAVLHQAIPS